MTSSGKINRKLLREAEAKKKLGRRAGASNGPSYRQSGG